MGTTINVNTAESIRYRDEYVGGSWITPAGAQAPDAIDVTIGGIGMRMLGFDGGNTEEKQSNSFELAHDIAFTRVNSGELNLEAHVHFMPSTNNTGDVKWFFDWVYCPLNGAPLAQTSLSGICTVNANERYFHKICTFKDNTATIIIPVPVGGFGIGDIIMFTLRRTPTTTGDTYPDDALLIKCAMHVPVDDKGSLTRYNN